MLSQIAYVPQQNFLFSTTVRNNIAFGEHQAQLNDVEAVARKSALHQDITQLPNAYNTLVGQNGVELSGGQKQRLSIARALLKHSQILILDDALSAVDAKTETSILQSLRKERADKTTIIAAHRLTSVKEADLILVLEDGHVIERGTHADLLERGGWYAQMWQAQEFTRQEG